MRTAELSPGTLAEAAEALAAGHPRPAIPLAGDDGAAAIATLANIVGKAAA